MLTQYCPIETAAEIVAERGKVLIVRDLLGPPRGFDDLQRCSRPVLADRLRRLLRAGIVSRTAHGGGRPSRTASPRRAESSSWWRS